MQTTYGLKTDQIHVTRGRLLCKPILGRYETASGILVVADLKKNPKIEKAVVLSVGGPFTNHGHKDCPICSPWYDKCQKKEQPGVYWAKPGDTIWMKRGFKKVDLEGKTHIIVPNLEIVATLTSDNVFSAPADMVLVEAVYDGHVEGSNIFLLHDRDKEYVGNFWGIVEAVGPEYKYGLKKGDKIRFRRHEGVKVEYGEKKLLSLKQKWVDAKEIA